MSTLGTFGESILWDIHKSLDRIEKQLLLFKPESKVQLIKSEQEKLMNIVQHQAKDLELWGSSPGVKTHPLYKKACDRVRSILKLVHRDHPTINQESTLTSEAVGHFQKYQQLMALTHHPNESVIMNATTPHIPASGFTPMLIFLIAILESWIRKNSGK